MTAAAARESPSAADPFGARGPKLAALLGLAVDARVLLAGALPDGWGDDVASYFERCDAVARISSLPARSPYDVVLWAPGAGEPGARFADALERARGALAPAGTLLVFAPNRFSLRRIAHHGPAALAASHLRSPSGYRAVLAGRFARVEEMAALPNLEAAEEWVAPASLPGPSPRAGYGERVLHALGLLREMYDGSLFVASARDAGTAPLMDDLAARIPGCVRPQVERFALRARGALVLVVRGADGRRFACRMAGAGEAARLVGRNAAFACRLHHDSSVREWVRARIPLPLAEFPLGEAVVFAEEAADGVIGWRVGGRARDALLADLGCFGCALAQDTSRTAVLDVDAVEALLPGCRISAAGAGLARAFAEVRRSLTCRVEGTPRVLAFAHGDFGVGNALADPASGRLEAVIDWDQAGEDAAGVDLLNLAVQVRRIERGEAPAAAFGHVARGFRRDGFASVGAAELDGWLCPGPAARAEMAAWTALRMVLRSARYPALFAKAAGDAAALVDVAGRLLAEVPAEHPAEVGAR